jgi:hypothetical protein
VRALPGRPLQWLCGGLAVAAAAGGAVAAVYGFVSYVLKVSLVSDCVRGHGPPLKSLLLLLLLGCPTITNDATAPTTRVLRLLQVYSLSWKAATGVAAAEGLAIGGWSVRSVRAEQAATAAATAELVRLRARAEKDLALMRALLQQKEATHSHEVRACVSAEVLV